MTLQPPRRTPRKRKRISPEEATIARRLKEIRIRRGKSQTEVAAAVGIKQPVLSECESGETRINGALLSALAKELKVSADEILGLKRIDTTLPKQGRLARRLQRIEELPPSARRSVLNILDAVLEKHAPNGHR